MRMRMRMRTRTRTIRRKNKDVDRSIDIDRLIDVRYVYFSHTHKIDIFFILETHLKTPPIVQVDIW